MVRYALSANLNNCQPLSVCLSSMSGYRQYQLQSPAANMQLNLWRYAKPWEKKEGLLEAPLPLADLKPSLEVPMSSERIDSVRHLTPFSYRMGYGFAGRQTPIGCHPDLQQGFNVQCTDPTASR
eukprot:5985552-Pyramimonas_sp.AAC.1